MIALIRPPQPPPRSAAVRRAHRLVATALLNVRQAAARSTPPAWAAWTFAGWVAAMSLWYAAHVIRGLW